MRTEGKMTGVICRNDDCECHKDGNCKADVIVISKFHFCVDYKRKKKEE